MDHTRVERRLAVILAADVAGYSKLMEADEEATLAAWHGARDGIIDPGIAAHGGRIVKHTGDGFLAEFATVSDAVRFAIAMRTGMAARNADLASARRMDFRIGINLGDIFVDAEDIHGDDVNIAARLEGLAPPGGILVSGPVYEQARRRHDDLDFADLGERAVKNIRRPVRVYRVLFNGDEPPTRRLLSRRALIAIAAVAAIGTGAAGLLVWQPWKAAQPDVAFPDLKAPTRHFKVKAAAKLDDAEALTIYDRIAEDLAAMYARSGDPSAAAYLGWRRYNRAPYRSTTHGRRYINNYANETAAAYGRYDDAGTLPVGSVLAKDAFEVNAQGDVVPGPLALMRKMPAGFNPDSRDWRYTMIMPDGSLFGQTRGAHAERVGFCIACHAAAGDAADHLFFLPEKYRIRFLDAR